MVSRNRVYRCVEFMKADKRLLDRIGSMCDDYDLIGNTVDPSDDAASREELKKVMQLAEQQGEYVHRIIYMQSTGWIPADIATEMKTSREAVNGVAKRCQAM